jgi:hypothetical protein
VLSLMLQQHPLTHDRVFDHIAHLGGALFGVWYYLYGPRLWDLWREVGAYMFSSKPKAVESRE